MSYTAVFVAYDDICRSEHGAKDTDATFDATIDVPWSDDYGVIKIQPWLDQNNLTIPLYQEFEVYTEAEDGEDGGSLLREWLRFPDQITAAKFRLLFG